MPAACSAPRTAAGRALARSERDRLLDHDVVVGNVIVEALAPGLYALDAIDHVLAAYDLAEHGVAPALRRRGRVVQEVVVGDVDEELGGGRMRVRRAGHGDRVVVV